MPLNSRIARAVVKGLLWYWLYYWMVRIVVPNKYMVKGNKRNCETSCEIYIKSMINTIDGEWARLVGCFNLNLKGWLWTCVSFLLLFLKKLLYCLNFLVLLDFLSCHFSFFHIFLFSRFLHFLFFFFLVFFSLFYFKTDTSNIAFYAYFGNKLTEWQGILILIIKFFYTENFPGNSAFGANLAERRSIITRNNCNKKYELANSYVQYIRHLWKEPNRNLNFLSAPKEMKKSYVKNIIVGQLNINSIGINFYTSKNCCLII